MFTRPEFHCTCCRGFYPWTELGGHADIPGNPESGHICRDCFKEISKRNTNSDKKHKSCKVRQIQRGFSIGWKATDKVAKASLLDETYGMERTQIPGGDFFTSPLYKNGSGIRDVLEQFELHGSAMSNRATISIQLSGFPIEAVYAMIGENVLEWLEKSISEDPEKSQEIFGESFKTKDWISYDEIRGITFKVGRYVNFNQFYVLSELCSELVETIVTSFYESRLWTRGVNASAIERDCKKACKNLVERYYKGTAHVQLPCRNKRAAKSQTQKSVEVAA